jgi:telomerase reverse transcriptase
LTEDDKLKCIDDLGRQLTNYIFEDLAIATHEGSFQFTQIMAKLIQRYSKINIEKIFKKHIKKPKIYGTIKTAIDEFLKGKTNVTDTQISEFLSNLVKLDSNTRNVENFIVEIVTKTLPLELFGKKNQATVLDHVKKLITMKKFEVMAYNDVMKTIKFTEIPWLNARKYHKRHFGSIVADGKLVIRELLTWLFNKFVIEVIRMNFYVTEKHQEHNRLFFYSKPVWYLITRCSMANLENMNLEKFQANEEYKEFSMQQKPGYTRPENAGFGRPPVDNANRNFQFVKREERFENIPIAKLRLVPKSDSVRPIMTFYKKFREPKTGKLTKVGMYLQYAKIVLRSFKRVLGVDMGYAVFDNYQIFQRYADYKKKWEEAGNPQLHYSTMDIKKCYDSVDIGTLFDLLRSEDIFKEFYLITRFHKIIRNRRFCFRTKENNDKVPLSSLFIMKTKDTAIPFTEIADLEKYTQDDIIKDGKTIYIDIPYKTVMTKEEILEQINVVCRKVVVKLGKSVYKLKKGLPQGLSISSVLSSFYYAVLEQKATRYLERDRFSIHNSLSMVLRLTDDY